MKRNLAFDPGPEVREQWLKALESVGVEGVRDRLRQQSGGSASAILGIGTVPFMTRGFAEAWLEDHASRARRREKRWRWAMIIVAIAGVSG